MQKHIQEEKEKHKKQNKTGVGKKINAQVRQAKT